MYVKPRQAAYANVVAFCQKFNILHSKPLQHEYIFTRKTLAIVFGNFWIADAYSNYYDGEHFFYCV